MKLKELQLLLLVLLAYPCILFGQNQCFPSLYSPQPVPTFYAVSAILRDGVGIVVTGLDDFSRAWGLKADQLEDVAEMGAKSSGWSINQGSNLVIAVSISSVAQREEDLYAFKIEVHGGSTSLETGGTDQSAAGLADVSAKRVIDIRKDDSSMMLSTMNLMVKSVADKMKRELLQLSLKRLREHPMDPSQNANDQ